MGRVRETREWLYDGGWGWLTAAMLLATALVLWRSDTLMECKERDIRILGVILQGIGFWSVGAGLRDMGLFFGSPDLMTLLRDYWAARPFLRSRRTVVATGKAEGMLTITGQGRGHVGLAPGASIEDRVTRLEQGYLAHDGVLDRLDRTQRDMKTSFEKAIADEAAKRTREIAEVRGTVSSTIAQGITLEWLGVGFFVVGMILSSVTPEIAVLFGHPHSCDGPFTFWGWRAGMGSPPLGT